MTPSASDGVLTPWTLWAKWSRPSQQPNSYHPLLCHLIDVAQCGQAMWRRVLSDAWKRHIADDLGLDDPTLTERWVILWAALHDLGKACPGFQLQLQDPSIQTLLATRLNAAGLPAAPAPWVGHGDVSAYVLRTLLVDLFGMPRPAALEIALAVGGHHGRFPSPDDLMQLPSASLGEAAWDAARRQYSQWLADALGWSFDGAPVTPPAHVPHAAAMALAGFVSVVDWIGSSETYFPHAAPDAQIIPSLTAAAYVTASRQRAEQALDSLGWAGWQPSTSALSFSALFDGKRPRPTQEAVIALASDLTAPAIVIIEAPMGEGKTEAAMYLADRWTTRYGQRGLYFALPSQASSNQMFERVTAFLQQRYPRDVVNAQLVHGHASLSATLRELRERSHAFLQPAHIYNSPGDDADDEGATIGSDGSDTAGAVVAAEWFASAKRALLAPFGVGTVDQALLAALQTLHVFVRVYGLSTKTVIVDEVHAYDTYMLTLLSRLMEWLGSLRTPVILLSATLPTTRRYALLAAYARGAGWPVPTIPTSATTSASSAAPTPYPRITWADAHGSDARPILPSTDPVQRRRQQVTLEWLTPAADQFALRLAARLDALLSDGGCAAIICNTVAAAQRLYHALQPQFPGLASDDHPQLDLLHARFPLEERVRREQHALRRFGRAGPRPARAILIATQIIEQSLDLDFDLMVSELAPADLVLQRMGRLHRHERSRPPHLQHPRLILLSHDAETAEGGAADTAGAAGAANDDGFPTFDSGSEHVYDPHILLRSWLALRRASPVITLPDDIEPLVASVYEDTDCPADASPALRARWDTTRAAQRQAMDDDAQQARQRYIGPPWSVGLLSAVAPFLRDEDAPELHPAFQALTRLTEQSVTIACLGGDANLPLLRPLRPHGPTITLHTAPSSAATEAFLNRSVSVTDRRVVFQLLEREVPSAWRKSALLRRLRPLYFNADGEARVGRWRLLLDPNEGLRIEPASEPDRGSADTP